MAGPAAPATFFGVCWAWAMVPASQHAMARDSTVHTPARVLRRLVSEAVIVFSVRARGGVEVISGNASWPITTGAPRR